MGTPFSDVYNCFLNKITDDMYLELTPEDTVKDLQTLLINSVPGFEFPRKALSYNINTSVISAEVKESVEKDGAFILGEMEVEGVKSYKVENSAFDNYLTQEEINILAILMKQDWLQRQVTSIENTRMKYSGSDFKFTSQANHLAKLITLLTECRRDSLHMQRLYRRRKLDDNGNYVSNWSVFRKK